MKQAEREAYPLQWPDGWVRTRPEHRRKNNNWKKTFGVYRDDLIGEVERLKSTSLVLSTNVPLNLRGMPREGFNPPDPGVAVYFERSQREDRSWRDVLMINAPDAVGAMSAESREKALDLIDSQFRKFSKQYHPDKGGDLPLFQQLVRARDQAKDFFNGVKRQEHEYALACDLFTEVRLNMHAIGLTIEAIRQIERCGASTMLERAFRGFQMALPVKGVVS